MLFYIYLAILAFIFLFLLSFVITFGLPYFTGAPFAVSTQSKVKRMMDMLKASVDAKGGKLTAIDVGSGDGRIVIALAENGFEAHGVEINPVLVWFSRLKIRLLGLDGQATIHRGSFWKHDFRNYDVVVLFGVFYIMGKLEKKLRQELKPGALVISNYFHFPDWKPIKEEHKVYVYKK